MDGLEVRECDSGYGSILVATKPFSKGTIVLQETPLLTFKARDPDDYIKKFASSSREVKNKILDMGHRSLRDIDQGLKSDGTSLAKQYSQDVNEVIIALDVRHTNAFSFGTSGKASLFWCACKANHSCKPNVAYSSASTSRSNKMTYIALCDIAIDEEINPSYIINIHTTNRKDRREKLLKTKNFRCECVACHAEDYCRSFRCPNSSCAEKKCRAMNNGGNEENELKWKTTYCLHEYHADESPLVELLEKEASLLARYKNLHSKLEFESLTDPVELRDIIKDGTKELSPTHYIVANTLRLLYHFAAGQNQALKEQGISADTQLESPWGEVISPLKFAQEAADACIKIVCICECISAQCNNCSGSSEESCCPMGTHEPAYDACIDVFYAIEKLVIVSSVKSISIASTLHQRYKTFLHTTVGEDDMKGMELVLKKIQFKQQQNLNKAKSATAAAVASRSCNFPSCTNSTTDLKACSRCSIVFYCCREHQVADWKTHKAACKKRNVVIPTPSMNDMD